MLKRKCTNYCHVNSVSRMAGDSHVDESKLKGLSKIFNGETIKGRANVSEIKFRICYAIVSYRFVPLQVAKATYAGVGLLILYFTLKPSKK